VLSFAYLLMCVAGIFKESITKLEEQRCSDLSGDFIGC